MGASQSVLNQCVQWVLKIPSCIYTFYNRLITVLFRRVKSRYNSSARFDFDSHLHTLENSEEVSFLNVPALVLQLSLDLEGQR